jgi:phosphoenolpyruvate-protein kinase (PTS system EI component)
MNEYRALAQRARRGRERLARLRHTPAVTIDGERVELLANIELPDDAARRAAGRRVRHRVSSAASSCS